MKKEVLPDLVLLVRSMSKAEKRAFRLQSARYKTAGDAPKNYLRLYDNISRHPDTAVTTDAKADDQVYLLNLLIDSLAQQQRKSSVEIDFRDQLSSATVMHRRGLEKKAFRLLDKLRQLSWESGAYEFGLEVVGTHMQLLTNIEDLPVLRQLIGERQKLLDALTLFHRYDELMLEIFSILQKNDNALVRRFLEKALKAKLPTDVRTQIHRHHLLAHAYISLKDFEATQKHHDIILQLFEKNPLFLRMRVIPYIMIVLNSGILAWHNRKSNRLKEALLRLRQLHKIIGPLQAFDKERITRYQLDLELRYHILENKPEQNLLRAAEIKQALKQDQQMEPYRANYLRYFMALSLFYCGRTREALQWLQPIIDNDKKGYYNLKIYTLAFLLRAACHYRQGNDDTGDALMLAFRRNKFFAGLRKLTQFIELAKNIPGGYKGEWWLL